MARRLVANLMLLVLIWTGTLLHDLAEDHGEEKSRLDGQIHSAPVILSLHDRPIASQSDADPLEHVHFVGVVSKHYVLSTHAQIPFFALQAPGLSCADLLENAKKERAPPLLSTNFQNRLYLANRRLLI